MHTIRIIGEWRQEFPCGQPDEPRERGISKISCISDRVGTAIIHLIGEISDLGSGSCLEQLASQHGCCLIQVPEANCRGKESRNATVQATFH